MFTANIDTRVNNQCHVYNSVAVQHVLRQRTINTTHTHTADWQQATQQGWQNFKTAMIICNATRPIIDDKAIHVSLTQEVYQLL